MTIPNTRRGMQPLRALLLVAALCTVVSAQAADKDTARTLPEFPGVMSIPVGKNLNYGGFFKKHQPVKIVFGVSDPTGQMRESLTNASLIIRYLKDRGYRYHIEFVLYGKAVLAADMWNQKYGGFNDLMEALHKQGVQFRVCHNSMYTLKVKSSDIHSYMKIIPAGILELAKKQMQGYAYISNR